MCVTVMVATWLGRPRWLGSLPPRLVGCLLIVHASLHMGVSLLVAEALLVASLSVARQLLQNLCQKVNQYQVVETYCNSPSQHLPISCLQIPNIDNRRYPAELSGELGV